MIKNFLILIMMIFITKAYSQVQNGYLAGTEANSSGLFELANMKCMGKKCFADGQSFMLPFTVEIESSINSISIANAEVYLTNIIKNEFNEKIRAFDYKSGVKLFGVQSEYLGLNHNSTKLLSINITRIDYIEYVELSQDGKTRLLFNIYGTLGLAEEDIGLTPGPNTINTDMGTKIDTGISIIFQIKNLEIAGYTRVMSHSSNNIICSKLDANGLPNKTMYYTFQLGLDLQYNLHNGKNGSQLYLFSNIQYGRYKNSLIAPQGNKNMMSPPTATKELNFKLGLRYTLPAFKKKKKKNKLYH